MGTLAILYFSETIKHVGEYVMKKLIGAAAYTYLHTQLGNPIF
jgi:hypothetical protein